MDFEPTATLHDAYSWESQVCQYREAVPPETLPGFSYYAGETPVGTVDCLLWWDRTTSGKPMIVGILNHYGFDSYWEKTGNINLWVRKGHQRRGIGRTLVSMADAMWGPINFEQQRYTAAGVALVKSLPDRPA